MFRPGLTDRARYYSVTFLNQLALSHRPQEGGSALAEKLIDIYFSLFKLLLEGRLGNAAARQQQQKQQHKGKYGKGGKNNNQKRKGQQEDEEKDEGESLQQVCFFCCVTFCHVISPDLLHIASQVRDHLCISSSGTTACFQ